MSEPILNLLRGKKEFSDQDIGSEIKSVDPFYFIQAADSQFGLIDRYLLKLPDPKWDKEIKLNTAFVAAVNKLNPKPRFLVICGDLTDAWPSTEDKNPQITDFKRIFSQLDKEIPLVCVCGNHDIGDIPTLEAIEEYKRDFGEDYFYFVVNNVLFIVINSQFYENRENVKDYAAKQDEWLECVLEKCKHFKHSVLFEHIPWFLRNFDEEDEYFNITRELRLNWLRKFKEAGIKKIFCGHYHRNAGGWYGDMELIVTSAIGAQLGDDKSGGRIVKVTESNIEHEYHSTEELPTIVEL